MAPQADREERRRKRQAIFDRILQNAPAIFNAAQLRVFLSALVQLDPYIDDVAEAIVGYDENNHRTPEEVLLSTIEGVSDSQLTAFALRLAFTAHIAVPRADETDFLAKAEGVFVPQQPKKEATAKKTVQKGDAKSLKKAAARMPDCGKQGKREKGGLTKTNRCGEESSITTARRQNNSQKTKEVCQPAGLLFLGPRLGRLERLLERAAIPAYPTGLNVLSSLRGEACGGEQYGNIAEPIWDETSLLHPNN